jgi:hypothetical protein
MGLDVLILYLFFYALIIFGVELLTLWIIYLLGFKKIKEVIPLYLSSAILGVLFYLLPYLFNLFFFALHFPDGLIAPFNNTLILIVFPIFIFLRSIKINRKEISLIDKINLSVIPLVIFWFTPFYLLKTYAGELVSYFPVVWRYFPLYFPFFLFLILLKEKEIKKIALTGLSIVSLLILFFIFTVPVKLSVDRPAQISIAGIHIPLKELKFNNSSNSYEEALRVLPFLPLKVSFDNTETAGKSVRFIPIIGLETDVVTFMEPSSSNYVFEREVRLPWDFSRDLNITNNANEILFMNDNTFNTLYSVSCKTENISEFKLRYSSSDFSWDYISYSGEKIILLNPKEIYEFGKDGGFISKELFPYRMQEDYYSKQFAVAQDGTIYAADAKNVYIVGTNGVNKRASYKIGEGSEFFVLSGMVANTSGDIFLSIKNSSKIYEFSNGQVSEFAKVSMPTPSREGTVNGVEALSIDKDEHLFALVHGDGGFTSIEEFDKDGNLVAITGFSTPDVSGAIVLNYSPECLNSHSYFYSLSATSEGYVALLETDPIDKNLVLKIFKKSSQ